MQSSEFENHHALRLWTSIREFRNKNELIDINIRVGSKVFPAHKIILASLCPYFRIILCKAENDNFQIELNLSPDGFSACLDYLYTGDIFLTITESNLLMLRESAEFLMLEEISRQCSKHLSFRTHLQLSEKSEPSSLFSSHLSHHLTHQRLRDKAMDFWQGVLEFRASNLLCDFTIIVEQQNIQAHKIILAVMSPYLQVILNEHQTMVSLVLDLPYSFIQYIIDYLYLGNVKLKSDKNFILNIKKVADLFMLQHIQKECMTFLRRLTSEEEKAKCSFSEVCEYSCNKSNVIIEKSSLESQRNFLLPLSCYRNFFTNRRNILETRSTSDLFDCLHCSFTSSSTLSLNEHIQSVHAGKIYSSSENIYTRELCTDIKSENDESKSSCVWEEKISHSYPQKFSSIPEAKDIVISDITSTTKEHGELSENKKKCFIDSIVEKENIGNHCLANYSQLEKNSNMHKPFLTTTSTMVNSDTIQNDISQNDSVDTNLETKGSKTAFSFSVKHINLSIQNNFSNLESYICILCKLILMKADDMKNHILNFHPAKLFELPIKSIMQSVFYSPNGKFICEDCCMIYKSLKILWIHKNTDHQPILTLNCLLCNWSPKNFYFFQLHKIFCHSTVKQNGSFTCSTCDKNFDEAIMLRIHSLCHLSSKQYNCSQCPFQEESENLLQCHINIHHNDWLSKLSLEHSQQCDKVSRKKNHHRKLVSISPLLADSSSATNKKLENECPFNTIIATNEIKDDHKNIVDKCNFFYCNICLYKTKILEELHTHTVSMHTKSIINCSKCTYSTCKKSNYQMHYHRMHIVGGKTLIFGKKCPLCNFKTPYFFSLKMHLRFKHPTFNFSLEFSSHSKLKLNSNCKEYKKLLKDLPAVNFLSKSLPDSSTSFNRIMFCQHCNFTSTNEDIITKHMATHHHDLLKYFHIEKKSNNTLNNITRLSSSNKFPDSTSNTSLRSSTYVINKECNHYKMHLKKKKLHRCFYCPFSTFYYNHLKNHTKKHQHKILKLSNFHCFQRQNNNHLEKFSSILNENLLHCKVCNACFTKPADLQEHTKSFHLEIANVFCNLCTFSTLNDYHLNFHKFVIHHIPLSVSPEYACNHCSLKFSSASFLKQHMTVCSSYLKKCMVCCSKFESDTALNEHVLTLSIYPCLNCPFKTHNINMLSLHVFLIHNNNYLQCPLCSYSVKNKRAFRHHLKIEHSSHTLLLSNLIRYNPLLEWRCPYCVFQGLSSIQLYNHIISFHSKILKIFSGVRKISRLGKNWLKFKKCLYCNYKSNLIINFQRHLKIHKKEDMVIKYCCSYCDYCSISIYQMKTHLFQNHSEDSLSAQVTFLLPNNIISVINSDDKTSNSNIPSSYSDISAGKTVNLENSQSSDQQNQNVINIPHNIQLQNSMVQNSYLHETFVPTNFVRGYMCPWCGFNSTFHKDVKLHIWNKHQNKPVSQLKKVMNCEYKIIYTPFVQLLCNICGAAFNNVNILAYHVHMCIKRLHSCKSCSFSCECFLTLLQHTAKEHRPKDFPNIQDLNKHIVSDPENLSIVMNNSALANSQSLLPLLKESAEGVPKSNIIENNTCLTKNISVIPVIVNKNPNTVNKNNITNKTSTILPKSSPIVTLNKNNLSTSEFNLTTISSNLNTAMISEENKGIGRTTLSTVLPKLIFVHPEDNVKMNTFQHSTISESLKEEKYKCTKCCFTTTLKTHFDYHLKRQHYKQTIYLKSKERSVNSSKSKIQSGQNNVEPIFLHLIKNSDLVINQTIKKHTQIRKEEDEESKLESTVIVEPFDPFFQKDSDKSVEIYSKNKNTSASNEITCELKTNSCSYNPNKVKLESSKTCGQSFNNMNQISQNKCDTETNIWPEHISNNLSNRNYEIMSLNSGINDNQILHSLQNSNNVTINHYGCLCCKFNTTNLQVMSEHVKFDHNISGSKSIAYIFKIIINNNNNLQCHLCGITFNTRLLLVLHIRMFHFNVWLYCEMCSFSTSNKILLENHLSEKHIGILNGKSLKCAHCSFYCIDQISMQIHLKAHLGDQFRICLFCTQYVNKQLYSTHLEECSKKPYNCKTCSFMTEHKERYQAHLNFQHKGEMNLKCPFCNYMCEHDFILTDHICSSHSEKWNSESKNESCNMIYTFNELPKTESETLSQENYHIQSVPSCNKKQKFKCPYCEHFRTSLEAHYIYHLKRQHSVVIAK